MIVEIKPKICYNYTICKYKIMPLEKVPHGVTERREKTKVSETVPRTNEAAKKKASKETKRTKDVARKRIKLAKSKEKREKKKPVVLTICGKNIERKVVNGKVTFLEKGSGTLISNLALWIEKQMQDPKLQKRIDENLKPFSSKLKKVDDAKREKIAEKLNKTKFEDIEAGEIDIDGKKTKDPVEKAAYLASLVSEQITSRTLKISKSALKTIKYKEYLDYPHILPANVRTIIVTRGDKKMVCSRAIDSPSKGGRISYVDVVTGKRVYLKGGDNVRVVGTISVTSEAYKQIKRTEQAYAKVRAGAHKTWKRGSEQGVDLRSSHHSVDYRYSSGGGGGSIGSVGRGVSYQDSAPASLSAPARLAPVPSLTQTPDEMKQSCTQETFKLPGRYMFASMLSPSLKKYPKLKDSKPKLIVYFAGRGHYDAILKWYKAHGQSQEPPAEVLAQAAREDFLSSKKRIFSMLKSRWEKGENVHFTLVSHMRPYLHPTDNGSSKYWYKELWSKSSANAIFASITSNFKSKSGAKSVENINLVGHSMGGKALAGVSRLHFPYKFSYFYSDATYWSPRIEEIKRNPKLSLYISYRKGTKTEKIALSIIKNLGLKPHKRGNETVFTSPNYPNIRVVANLVPHSANVGQYLNPAWELAQRAQTGKLKSTV